MAELIASPLALRNLDHAGPLSLESVLAGRASENIDTLTGVHDSNPVSVSVIQREMSRNWRLACDCLQEAFISSSLQLVKPWKTASSTLIYFSLFYFFCRKVCKIKSGNSLHFLFMRCQKKTPLKKISEGRKRKKILLSAHKRIKIKPNPSDARKINLNWQKKATKKRRFPF